MLLPIFDDRISPEEWSIFVDKLRSKLYFKLAADALCFCGIISSLWLAFVFSPLFIIPGVVFIVVAWRLEIVYAAKCEPEEVEIELKSDVTPIFDNRISPEEFAIFVDKLRSELHFESAPTYMSSFGILSLWLALTYSFFFIIPGVVFLVVACRLHIVYAVRELNVLMRFNEALFHPRGISVL